MHLAASWYLIVPEFWKCCLLMMLQLLVWIGTMERAAVELGESDQGVEYHHLNSSDTPQQRTLS